MTTRKPSFDKPELEDRRRVDRGPPPGVEDRRVVSQGRRAAPRIKTLKAAKIVLRVGPSVRCVVRNVSKSGARLEVESPILQNRFDLVFDDPDWPSQSCRVVWRNQNGIGVEFDEPLGFDLPF